MFDQNEMKYLAKLAQKLNKAQEMIGSLAPDGFNDHDKWCFVSSNQLKFHMNRIFPKVGLAWFIEIINDETVPHGKTKYGNIIYKSTVEIEFTIIDSETGFYQKKKFKGSDQDSSKSFPQAVTECFKRFWFNMLAVSEKGEDPDNNKTEAEAENKKNQNQPKKKEAKKEPKTGKQKIAEIYKKFSLDKENKDSVFADFKKKHGNDYSKWDEKVFAEMEKKMAEKTREISKSKKDEKKQEEPKEEQKQEKTSDSIMQEIKPLKDHSIKLKHVESYSTDEKKFVDAVTKFSKDCGEKWNDDQWKDFIKVSLGLK